MFCDILKQHIVIDNSLKYPEITKLRKQLKTSVKFSLHHRTKIRTENTQAVYDITFSMLGKFSSHHFVCYEDCLVTHYGSCKQNTLPLFKKTLSFKNKLDFA